MNNGSRVCSLTLLLISCDQYCVYPPPPPQLYYSLFSGTTRVSRCQKRNFWTLWCKGRLTEADALTSRLGAITSGLTSAYLHHPPIFFTGPDAFPAAQPKASKH